ncbi:MAG: isoprenyl transferase [Candidatus Omnitrophota bacterium]|nr:MAG: isoprenyl transferase [Candidatus Omnitrophota bacterium]
MAENDKVKEKGVVPNHVAIIMDGNGRWAKERGLPRVYGHRKGGQRLRQLLKEAKRLKVKSITIFAFSTENWDRPRKEINYLFSYMEGFLSKYKNELMKEEIRLRMIGRRDRIPKTSIKKIEEIESLTKNNKKFFFNIALDFGGRWDITEAARKIIRDYEGKRISRSQITEEVFGSYLSLADTPSPDLLIRTSGEQRVSNFLLWDLAYAEFYFSQVYWPDFDVKQFRGAIKAYSERNRRFGGIGDGKSY